MFIFQEAKFILSGAALIIIFGLLSNVILAKRPDRAEEVVIGSWACTAEVQMCPDGHAVGRMPPYCQFASC